MAKGKSSRADGRPSFAFYPQDWLGEKGLVVCGLEGRGLWIEMLCLMWSAPRRGWLVYEDCDGETQGISIERLAATVAQPVKTVERVSGMLMREGVASRDKETGWVYCRRMRREAEAGELVSAHRSEAGKKGMKNRYQIGNKRVTNSLTNGVTGDITNLTLSSSLSSSSLSKERGDVVSADPGPVEISEETLRRFPSLAAGLGLSNGNGSAAGAGCNGAVAPEVG